ncbi:MAG: hypothetical protein ACREMM_06955 [Gemmatimonadales bacterium]
MNAILAPSGDQAGCDPSAVSLVADVPPELMTYTPPESANAIVPPSGDQAGSPPYGRSRVRFVPLESRWR